MNNQLDDSVKKYKIFESHKYWCELLKSKISGERREHVGEEVDFSRLHNAYEG